MGARARSRAGGRMSPLGPGRSPAGGGGPSAARTDPETIEFLGPFYHGTRGFDDLVTGMVYQAEAAGRGAPWPMDGGDARALARMASGNTHMCVVRGVPEGGQQMEPVGYAMLAGCNLMGGRCMQAHIVCASDDAVEILLRGCMNVSARAGAEVARVAVPPQHEDLLLDYGFQRTGAMLPSCGIERTEFARRL